MPRILIDTAVAALENVAEWQVLYLTTPDGSLFLELPVMDDGDGAFIISLNMTISRPATSSDLPFFFPGVSCKSF